MTAKQIYNAVKNGKTVTIDTPDLLIVVNKATITEDSKKMARYKCGPAFVDSHVGLKYRNGYGVTYSQLIDPVFEIY